MSYIPICSVNSEIHFKRYYKQWTTFLKSCTFMDLQVYTMYLFGVKKIKNNICDDNNALKQRDSMNCVRILAHILEEGRGTIKLIPFINRIFFYL